MNKSYLVFLIALSLAGCDEQAEIQKLTDGGVHIDDGNSPAYLSCPELRLVNQGTEQSNQNGSRYSCITDSNPSRHIWLKFFENGLVIRTELGWDDQTNGHLYQLWTDETAGPLSKDWPCYFNLKIPTAPAETMGEFVYTRYDMYYMHLDGSGYLTQFTEGGGFNGPPYFSDTVWQCTYEN